MARNPDDEPTQEIKVAPEEQAILDWWMALGRERAARRGLPKTRPPLSSTKKAVDSPTYYCFVRGVRR